LLATNDDITVIARKSL